MEFILEWEAGFSEVDMRRVTHYAAMSLDARIAGPKGEVDWLFMDQDYGLNEFFAGIDTVLIGRKTYEFMLSQELRAYRGVDNYVFSRRLNPLDHPDVTVVSDDAAGFVEKVRKQPGKGIWLVGGGELFGALLDGGQVDELILAVHPILLARGIPLLPERAFSVGLKLAAVKSYDTGLVLLKYLILGKE